MTQKYELVVTIQRLYEIRYDGSWRGIVKEVKLLGGTFIDFTDVYRVNIRVGFEGELERTQFLMNL
jgi:hypothetical protein